MRARRLAVILLLVLAACAGTAVPAETPPSPAPLPPARPAPEQVPGIEAARIAGPVRWDGPDGCAATVVAYVTDQGLGGLSGLAYDAAAREFVAVADDAGVYRLAVTGGAVMVWPLGLLADTAPPRRSVFRDAEALAVLDGSRWAVAFERNHRVWLYPAGADGLLAGPPAALPLPADWAALPANTGVEALAADGRGGLIAIQEGSPLTLGRRSVWRFAADGSVREGGYAGTPGFVPGDAVLAPDGSLLVLERRPTAWGGFTTRVVRVRPVGADLERADTVLALPDGIPAVNYEGLAVVPGAGGWRLVLVSDDDDEAGTVIVTALLRGC